MELATTIVNLFELFLGAFKYREAKTSLTGVKGLCSTLRILSFTEEASLLVAKILSGLEKAGRGIEIRDLLVGATALQETYAVATPEQETLPTNTSPHSPIRTRTTAETLNRLGPGPLPPGDSGFGSLCREEQMHLRFLGW